MLSHNMNRMNTQILQGFPVVSGTIRGRAKIVRDWGQNTPIDAGMVLIVRFPVPKISSLLKQASALLCAYGSADSYLANAAREQGIPAVFKLGQSLEAVSDGEWVSIDSGAGAVSWEPNPSIGEPLKN